MDERKSMTNRIRLGMLLLLGLSGPAAAEFINGSFSDELPLAAIVLVISGGLWLLTLSALGILVLRSSRTRERVRRAALHGFLCAIVLLLILGAPYRSPLSSLESAFDNLYWLLGPSALVTILSAARQKTLS